MSDASGPARRTFTLFLVATLVACASALGVLEHVPVVVHAFDDALDGAAFEVHVGQRQRDADAQSWSAEVLAVFDSADVGVMRQVSIPPGRPGRPEQQAEEDRECGIRGRGSKERTVDEGVRDRVSVPPQAEPDEASVSCRIAERGAVRGGGVAQGCGDLRDIEDRVTLAFALATLSA